MYVANTHLKPVVGLDLHFVNLPFPFVPMPHPYIGLVIDPFDYIPFIGASVKVNKVPRGNTDTAGMIITFIHIPFGAGFTIMPIIGHDSSNFFGSKTVNVEGAPFSGAGYILMTCNDIGLPLSFQPGKKLKPIPSLYLPTSFSIPLQWGKPVYVGGPMVPHFSLMALLKAFAFGAALKGLGKLGGKLLKVLNRKVLSKFPATQKLSDRLCKKGLEPVDLISGRVFYEHCDFELPGPIPICWCRNWDSDSSISGPLGHGISFTYDRCIRLWSEEGCLSLTMEDGRVIAFPLLYHGESFYHPQEKVLLRRKQNGHFLLEDYNNACYLHFNHDPEPGLWCLSFIENYNGNRVQLHYTGRHLRAITDSAGRHLLFELDKAFRITQVTVKHRDVEQVLMRYGYNEEGDLVSITDALEKAVNIEYKDHLMIKKTDRNGQSFYWEYDHKKRCVHTWGDGGILEGYIEYHKGYNTVTNSLGEVTTYYFDENNLCVQQTDHYGNHFYTEYTDDFEIYREIDEEGRIIGYSYDDMNRLNTLTLPDGNTQQFHYNEHNQIRLAVNADGHSETYLYDDMRRLRNVNYSNGRVLSYKYNEDGQLETIVDGTDLKTTMTYDEDENLAGMVFTDGSSVSWKYDALGRCIQTVNSTGENRYLEYDALDRITKLHLPDGNTVKLQYNAYQQITHAADRYGQVQFEYTPLGKMKKRRQHNTETQFLYDTEERLQTIINEKGRHFSFDYNKRGELITETGFDGVTRRYERDASGEVIKVLRPGGRSATYEHDANGQIIKIEYHDGSWELFNYNKSGFLKEAINEHSTVRYTYDRQGNLSLEEQDGYQVQSVYDKWGNRIHVTSSLGADIQLQRVLTGLVTNMQAVGQQKGAAWGAHITYNPAGREILRKMPGDLVSEWQYDQSDRPAEHKVSRKGAVQSWKQYSWAPNERLTSIFDAVAKSNTHFKYDAKGYLVFAQYANNSIVHRTADETGNLYETKDQSDRRYSAAGALLESKKFTYQYDEEGYLLSKTDKATQKKTRYEWYANGMLKKVVRPDGKAVTFTYDAIGRRISKCFDGKITRWVWDNDVPLHEWSYAEKQKPQQVVNEWGDIEFDKEEPNPVNAAGDTKGITWIFEADNFLPCAKLENGKSYSIINDHLGTPQAAYDETGKQVWECALDIYGRSAVIQGSKDFIPFRYQGQYEDVETGLYYNRHRYYSPEEGSYVSQDPISWEGGLRLYSYAGDPNVYMDIFGLNPVYFPLDNLGRPTGGYAKVTSNMIGTGSSAKRSIKPPGWKGGKHPYHHQRGHLIANNHGGSGKDERNLVTITDGTNQPGMRKIEDNITAHVRAGNTVDVIVKPIYKGNNPIPESVHIFAMDQNFKIIANNNIPNGAFQNHKKSGCC